MTSQERRAIAALPSGVWRHMSNESLVEECWAGNPHSSSFYLYIAEVEWISRIGCGRGWYLFCFDVMESVLPHIGEVKCGYLEEDFRKDVFI